MALKIDKKYFVVFGIVVVATLGLIFLQNSFSGYAVLELNADYHEGEILDGVLELSLNKGEFIPASTKVVFENSEERREFDLEDIVSEESVEGMYYIEGKNLSGEGVGYGLMGTKESPEISFVFNVSSDDEEKITEEIVSGDISADRPLVYNLEEGQTAELVPGSVAIGSKTLNDEDIDFEILNGTVFVSTVYFEEEEGFGADYLSSKDDSGDSEEEFWVLEINLSALDLNFSAGELKISFVYNDDEILSLSSVLQESDIVEIEEPVLLEVSEFSSQGLTEDERQILVQKFGDVSVVTTRSEVLDGRLIRNYKLGDYELVASYDYDLDSLDEQMERDRVNFLRDLVRMISEEKVISEDVGEFLVSSDF
ncbi:hypothetical protein K8R30_02245 [archaeon]|nr:hypothetical protein [archaeon]